jgi:hypothetical protein
MKGRQGRKLSQQIRRKQNPILTNARLRENMRRVEGGKNELISPEERLIAKSLGAFKDSRGVSRIMRVVVVWVDRSHDPGSFDHRNTQLACFIDEGAIPPCAADRKGWQTVPQAATVNEKIHSPVRGFDNAVLTNISAQLGFPRGRPEVPIVR